MASVSDVTVAMIPAEASIIRLQPGDRLIVRIPRQKLAHFQSEAIRKHVSRWAGGVPVIVLTEGSEIDVLRTDSESE